MNKRVEMTRTAEENPECGIWDLNTNLLVNSDKDRSKPTRYINL